jgi:hypothetical protein
MTGSEGQRLNGRKFRLGLGFKLAYVAAVIKSCDPSKQKGFNEDSVKSTVSEQSGD